MDLHKLKQSYQEQLVKAGVHPLKAEQAAKALSEEELRFISDIWLEWATTFTKIEPEKYIANCLLDEVHHSAT